MKKIKITAILFAPANLLYIGGTNLPILTYKHAISESSLSTQVFGLISGYVTVGGETCQISGAYQRTRDIVLRGGMNSIDKKYIRNLLRKGWVLSVEGAKHHNIKIP
ncbi:MAG: hypothetical protein Q7R78_02865 [bacterium]|nr:hypothetical protein [bacterium]